MDIRRPRPEGRAADAHALILKPDTTTYFKSYETPDDDDEDGEEDGQRRYYAAANETPGPFGNPLDNEGFVASEACSMTPKPAATDKLDGHEHPNDGDAGGEALEHGDEDTGGFIDPSYKDHYNPFRESRTHDHGDDGRRRVPLVRLASPAAARQRQDHPGRRPDG